MIAVSPLFILPFIITSRTTARSDQINLVGIEEVQNTLKIERRSKVKMPLAHISLPVSSLEESTAFYQKLLAPLGYGIYLSLENTVGMGPQYGNPDFWLHLCPKDGKEGASKTHVAFAASSQKQVHAFYEAGLKAGAKDNGKPGERSYTKGYYAAYLLDLEGNNVECLYYQPWWLTAMQYGPSVVVPLAAAGVAWWGGRAGWGM